MDFPKNFTIANKFTQQWEKGFVNHPKDPGGVTYNGVSLRFLKDMGIDINGDGVVTAEDIYTLYKNKDQAKVDEIFWKAFWRDPNLDRFEDILVQTAIYDCNVNTGRTRSAMCLQEAVNRLTTLKLVVDGKPGPKTVAAVLKLIADGKAKALALSTVQTRLDFHNMLAAKSPYADGRDYRPFIKGWRNRCNDLIKTLQR